MQLNSIGRILNGNVIGKLLLLPFILAISQTNSPAAERAIVTGEKAVILGSLPVALNAFSNDCGRYPTTTEGFTALINCPTNIPSSRWHGPYLDKVPKDAWGRDYVYRCPGTHHTNGFDLYSCGFDGISKSGGDDPDDINNWDPSSPHGGNDGFLNPHELLFHQITMWPGFHILFLFLVMVSLAGAIQLFASIYSQRVREMIHRNWVFHFIWFAVSFGVISYIIYRLQFPVVGR